MAYRICNYNVLYANSIDPDQTPRSVASDLGLHYLPMSLLQDDRLKWVKGINKFSGREGNSVKYYFPRFWKRVEFTSLHLMLSAIAPGLHTDGLDVQVSDTGSSWSFYITKTYIFNFDPLKPHFYIVKRGLQGYTLFFLISAQKHRLWVLVRTASVRRF